MTEAKERRTKYKEEVRREILDVAKDLLENEGYEKFSMRNLEEKLEYPPTTIFLYFKDKDDLLFTISEEVAERLFAALTNSRTTYSDPLESLRQALLYLIESGFNKPDEYRVFLSTRPRMYGTLEEFMEKESIARNSYLEFRDIVKNCVVTGKLQEIDVDVLTQVLIVVTLGFVALTAHQTSFPWIDRNVLAHTLVEGLLRGYRNYARTHEGYPEKKQ